MTRFAHVLAAAAYLTLAVTIAAALIRLLGWDAGAAFTLAAIGAVAAAQAHVALAGRADAGAMRKALAALEAGQKRIAEAAETAVARTEALERRLAEDGAESRAARASEMRTLQGLMRQLAGRLEARGGAADNRAASSKALALAEVRAALEEGRVDLHLQPIVTLPQRRAQHYESFSRLRDPDGRPIQPATWLGVAEETGLVTAIDNLLLFRCMQLVRRLAAKERKIAVFCNVAIASLGDETFFPQFLDFLRRNADLAGALVFEIGQDAFAQRSLEAARNMSRLADFGCRFSIDKVNALDIDFAELKRAGVRFLKAPAALLVSALREGRALGSPSAPDIGAADLAELAARHGVELIAEKIEEEAQVVEILELDIALGQGHLFGAPKPLKEGVLEEADARGLQQHLRRMAG